MSINRIIDPASFTGGESGIRTPDPAHHGIHDFESCAFDQLGQLSASIYIWYYVKDINYFLTRRFLKKSFNNLEASASITPRSTLIRWLSLLSSLILNKEPHAPALGSEAA